MKASKFRFGIKAKVPLLKIAICISIASLVSVINLSYLYQPFQGNHIIGEPAYAFSPIRWLTRKLIVSFGFQAATKAIADEVEDGNISLKDETNPSSQNTYELRDEHLAELGISETDLQKIINTTDDIFHKKYPGLGGRRILPSETELSEEWMKIRNCTVVVDFIFYKSHPELNGRKIRSDEFQLASKWKEIRQNINGCSD